MKKHLKEINPFLLIFILLGLRSTILGASFGDALVFASVCGIFALEKYIVWKKGPDINADLKIQLDQIKSYVTGLTMKQSAKKDPIEPPGPGQRWF